MTGRAMRQKKKLKIAIVSDAVLPTPVDGWGGLQRVVYDWATELLARGHDVTMFAAEGSSFGGRLVETIPPTYKWDGEDRHASIVMKHIMSENFDVIHDNTHWHSMAKMSRDLPIINHMHDPIQVQDRNVICCSFAQKHYIGLHRAIVVYNGVHVDSFPFVEGKEDYLLFMSHIGRHKGCHLAIAAARKAGRRLYVAGHSEWNEDYGNMIKSTIDGEQIVFLGPISGDDKKRILGSARALLLPSQYCEPGAVAPLEAMACGTPVITSTEGCLPEYVEHGVTGYNCNSIDEMVAAIDAVDSLSPKTIRSQAEREWTVGRAVDNLESVYGVMANGYRWDYTGTLFGKADATPISRRPYAVEWKHVSIPVDIKAGSTFTVNATVRNIGRATWTRGMVFGYDWRQRSIPSRNNGLLTEIDRSVRTNERYSVSMEVAAPNIPGKYELEIDIRQHGQWIEFIKSRHIVEIV